MDPHAWLREKDDPRVMEFLEAENARTHDALAHLGTLRRSLYEETLARIKETDLSVPFRKGDYFYYSRTEKGKAYPIHCRKRGSLEAEPEVVLDVNALAQGHEYTDVTALALSPDHRLLAYAVDRTGYERATVYVKEIATGKHLPDEIEEIGSYSLAWANDNATLFYTRLDDTNRPDRLYRHTLGIDPSLDPLVFHEEDERFFLGIERTLSGAYLLLGLGSHVTSEAWILEADNPAGSFRCVEPRRHGIEYSVEHGKDGLYILTNDDALNFRVVVSRPEDPGRARWRDLVPHDPAVFIQGIEVFAGHLVLSERRDGTRCLRVQDLVTGEEHGVEKPEPVSTMAPERNAEFETTVFRFSYTSLVTPHSVYDYDLVTRERTLLKQQEVPGDYDPADYVSARMWATAEDGARVPISVVHRREVDVTSPQPTLLYGYGAYGYSIEPEFNPARLPLLDRGLVFAVAHVRGGSEMGRQWYEDGKYLKKRNSFTDFIAAAEALIASGMTSPDRITARGASAGGLLIGAVLNLRPDLFRAVHAGVPFVDVLNTMLDPSIPLTTLEYDEWGDPNDPVYRDYIAGYAPYENVAAGDYPDLLVTAGLNDPRVHYWEPAKWVAKLREVKTNDTPLLLKTNLGAGHGGASGRYERFEELAFENAFILDRVGLGETAPMPPGRRWGSLATMHTLSVREARRLALARAGLLKPEWTGLPSRAGRGERAQRSAALAVVRRFGYLQLDTVSIAGARSHTLVLLSRLPGFRPSLGERLLAPDGTLFEFWGHEACWIPLELYAAFGWRRKRYRHHPWWGDILGEYPDVARTLMRRLRSEGPLMSADLEGASKGGWWNHKPAKKVAEALWSRGEVVIRERRDFRRVYDLPGRVLPDAVRRARMSQSRALRELLLVALGGFGWARTGTMAQTWRFRNMQTDLKRAFGELQESGAITPCAVVTDGGKRLAGWIRPEDLELADRLAAVRPRRDQGVLLSPFDPLLWDRARVATLFGFDQVLEIFKPAPQRKYGYYCLPVLAGERLVARVDLKADRAAGRLRVLSKRFESTGGTKPANAEEAQAMQSALDRYAAGIGLEL